MSCVERFSELILLSRFSPTLSFSPTPALSALFCSFHELLRLARCPKPLNDILLMTAAFSSPLCRASVASSHRKKRSNFLERNFPFYNVVWCFCVRKLFGMLLFLLKARIFEVVFLLKILSLLLTFFVRMKLAFTY